MLQLRHVIGVRSTSTCVWEHNFYNDKNISPPSYWILKVYDVLKELKLCFASVVNNFLVHRLRILDLRRFWEMITCLGGGGVLFCIIVLCGVVPHIFSWVVFPQVFIVWVNDSLFNGRLGINFVLEFSRRVEIFSGSKDMYCCLGSKCGYRILQLLVKLIPL